MSVPSVIIHPIPVLQDNYVWVLMNRSQQTAVVVDPGEAAPVKDFLNQSHLHLAAILLTHHHHDHTNGATELATRYAAPVFGPANERIATLTHPVKEGDKINIEHFPLVFHVIEIPGHTLGHIAYYSPGLLFCGDTLFAGGCGKVFEGTMEQMVATLKKITSLHDETKIYCGHEYTLNNLRFAQRVEPNNANLQERLKRVCEWRNNNIPTLPSTLKEEKETNPFLRCDSPEIIANVERYANQPALSPTQVFTILRQWKNKVG